MASTQNVGGRHPAQWLALAIGVIYLVVGVAGFFVTGFEGFAEPEGDLLLGIFEVNPLHNIVHLVIGLLGVALWVTLPLTAIYGWILAIGYGATWLFGLAVAGSDEPANFLALNQADNWLHLVSAVAGAGIVAWTWSETRGGTRRPTTARGTADGTATPDRPARDRPTGRRRP